MKGLKLTRSFHLTWQGFEAVRYFRGVRYEISIRRKGSGNEVALEVDGKPIPGTVIPLPDKDVRNLKVTAYIGQE